MGAMVQGYAIVIVRGDRDFRLRRCGVRIDVPPHMVHRYAAHGTLHLQVVADTLPAGCTIEWCSEWRRGVYSRDEPLGGWRTPEM